VKGTGNQLDYGMRIYDPRLGRFLSADPLIVQGQEYPELSPYQFASNTPIQAIDLDGLEARSYVYIYLDSKPVFRLATYYETNGWMGDGTVTTKWDINKGQISSYYSYNNGKQTVSKQLYKFTFTGTKEKESFSITKFLNGLEADLRGGAEDNLEGHDDGANAGSGGKQAPLAIKIIANINPLVSTTNLIKISSTGKNTYNEEPSSLEIGTNVLDVMTLGATSLSKPALETLDAIIIGTDAATTIIDEVTKTDEISTGNNESPKTDGE
jgi:RHS repeat-associated protein